MRKPKLTPTQAAALEEIENLVPKTPAEVERVLKLSRGGGRKVLAALEKKGYAERRDDGRWWSLRSGRHRRSQPAASAG